METTYERDPTMLTDPDGYPARTVPERHYLCPELGAVLNKARVRRGWGLRLAARKMGLNHGYLFALGAGQRAPSTAVAEVLVTGLGLNEAEAAWLRAEAVPDVGRSSPRRVGHGYRADRRTSWRP